jgi:hypothetical protein
MVAIRARRTPLPADVVVLAAAIRNVGVAALTKNLADEAKSMRAGL